MISLSLRLHQEIRYEVDGKVQVQLQQVRGSGNIHTAGGPTWPRCFSAWWTLHCGGIETCWQELRKGYF